MLDFYADPQLPFFLRIKSSTGSCQMRYYQRRKRLQNGELLQMEIVMMMNIIF